MNIQEVTTAVVNNAKTNQWLSCHYDLVHDGIAYRLGVKAFGRWVQILKLNGITSNVPEQKTNKRMAELLSLEIMHMVNSQETKQH